MSAPGKHQMLEMAQIAEQTGNFNVAEVALRSVIDASDATAERSFIGSLYINLGSVAEQDGRPADAAKHYSTAISLLDGEKGDAILQNAHAHFNLANVLLDARRPESIDYAQRALSLYKAFPFSEPSDVIDASVALVLAGIGSTPISEPGMVELWRTVRNVQLTSLTYRNIHSLVVMMASAGKRSGDQLIFPNTLSECRAWAGNEFATAVEATLRDGKEKR